MHYEKLNLLSKLISAKQLTLNNNNNNYTTTTTNNNNNMYLKSNI